MDEVHVDDSEISSEIILEISKKIYKDSYLWIACQSDTNTDKDDKNLLGMLLLLILNQIECVTEFVLGCKCIDLNHCH